MDLFNCISNILATNLNAGDKAFYGEKKFQRHRFFSAILLTIGAIVSALFWFWDYSLARDLAYNTIHLRLILMLIIAIPALYLYINLRSNYFCIIYTSSMLFGYLVLLLIMQNIHLESVYNTGAFLIFFMFVPILNLQLNNTQSVVHILAVTLSPNLFYLLGYTNNLDLLNYNILALTFAMPLLIMVLILNQLITKAFVSHYQLLAQKSAAEDLARKDTLTETFNKRAFHEFGEKLFLQARRYKRPLSLIMLDIDFFKSVNDEHGHIAGDDALRQTAQIIADQARGADIFCRIGGEEFALLLPETNLIESKKVAERIREKVKDHSFALNDGTSIHLTVSLGISVSSETVTSFHELIQNADKALYEAKDAGRNKIATVMD